MSKMNDNMEVEIQKFSSDFDQCFSKPVEGANTRTRSIHLTRRLTKLKKKFGPQFVSDSNFLGGQTNHDGRHMKHQRDDLSVVSGFGNGNTNSFSLMGTLFFIINDNHHNGNNHGGDPWFGF